jgi:hypothetical protein
MTTVLDTFEVRLESQTDKQARIVSVQAESADDARGVAERQELGLVEFSLLPPERDVWECPPGRSEDEADGIVDLARWDAYDPAFARSAAQLPYSDAVRAAKNRLSDLRARIDVADTGKVRGRSLSARAAARLLAHDQQEPYAVVSVDKIDPAEIERRRTMVALAKASRDPEAWEKILGAMRAAGVPLAAVTAALNGVAWQKQIDGSSTTVYSSATVKGTLHTGFTANYDTDDFFNDASASEVTGTGYTAGGITFSSKTSTYDTATDQVRLDAADLSWATSTISATDAAFWVDTAGASSTDPFWGSVDFGGTVSTTAGTFLITFDATGVFVFDLT